MSLPLAFFCQICGALVARPPDIRRQDIFFFFFFFFFFFLVGPDCSFVFSPTGQFSGVSSGMRDAAVLILRVAQFNAVVPPQNGRATGCAPVLRR